MNTIAHKNQTMKPCHVAALALVGWYLMKPPSAGPYQFDTKEPLSKWDQIMSFDSSRACEIYRSEAAEKFSKNKAHDDPQFARYNEQLYLNARCVTSDDPRLKAEGDVK